MGLAAAVKRAATRATVNQVLGLLDSSDANLLRIVRAIKMVSPLDWYDKGLAKIEDYIEQGHPGIEAVRRAVRVMSKATRRKFVENFVMNVMIEGHHRRFEFYEKEGFGPPTTLLVSPTTVCNLKCYGCYAEGHDVHSTLDFEALDRMIGEAKAVGTSWVQFVGGEPFLVKDLWRIFESHPDVSFNVFTNATLLGDREIDRLAEMGHVAISVSVEGLQMHTDERRGRGIYALATGTIRKLAAKGVSTAFSATYSRANFESVGTGPFFDAMMDAGCVFGWFFPLMPVGSCAVPQLMLTPYQKLQFKDRLAEMRATKPMLFFDFGHDEWLAGGCMAARKLIHVNSQGGVEPCMFTQYAVDNVKGKSFSEVLKSKFFGKLREDERIRKDPRKTCLVTDVPEVFREIVHEEGASTQSGDTLMTAMAPVVDAFARSDKELHRAEKK
ncbi:MAG: radical SAM protein [Planctomycetes bacterium]|nr:radical SAM protein [Planctomycetota bacterium]